MTLNEYTTENGTTLFYRVFYDLGGWNNFTSRHTPRGYYISIQRKHNGFAAFSDLRHPDGAMKMLLTEVSRKSEKQRLAAEAEALDTLKSIVQVYNDRGIKL